MERIYQPLKKRLKIGETLTTQVSRIDHEPYQDRFQVVNFLGSGFSSAVYQAENGQGEQVALKVFRPPTLKEKFRDFFHRLTFGMPLPARFIDSALVAAEGWHDILTRAIEVEGLDQLRLPRSYGHGFIPQLGTNFSVYEFVRGEVERPPVVGTQAEIDYLQKRSVFNQLDSLAQRIGMGDITRQFRWLTLVAPLNGKTVVEDGKRIVCPVDTQPGLPVLPITPYSPADVLVIGRMISQGRLVHFDQTDFTKLDQYVADRLGKFDDLKEVILKTKQADQDYRTCLPYTLITSLLQRKPSASRARARAALANIYLTERIVSEREACTIGRSDSDALFHLVLNNIPLVGPSLQRLMFNDGYLTHLKDFIVSPEYRHLVNDQTVAEWVEAGRISPRQAEGLSDSDLRMLIHRPLSFSPRRLHRFLTDGDYRLDILKKGIVGVKNGTVGGWKFLTDSQFRHQWLVNKIQQAENDEGLSPETAEVLYKQAEDSKTDELLRDIVVSSVGVNLIDAAVSLALGKVGLDTNNNLLMAYLAARWGTFFVPRPSLGGFLRAGYLTIRVGQDHHKNRDDAVHLIDMRLEGINVLLSAVTPYGNVSAPLRLAGEMPELSGFLVANLLDGVVSKIPVYGEHGTVVERFIYEVCYNKWARRITPKLPDNK